LFAVGMLLALIAPTPFSAQTATPAAASVSGKYEVEPGRSLYLYCIGTGSPMVLFESGAQSDSSAWFGVMQSVGQVTRACAYDRAGLGQSDPAPAGKRTIQDSVGDLHALLTEAKLAGPHVLVGASLGGLITRLYAGQYPDEVAGLVLIDGLTPGFISQQVSHLPAALAFIVITQASGEGPRDQERIDILASDDLIAAAALPPDVPAIVLASDTFQRDLPSDLDWRILADIEVRWRAAQLEQAEVLGARFKVAEKSGHDIHQEQPQVVVDAVTDVVEAVRDPTSWATPEP
jgi:pimeloyl-ACP methyl ester carboxylesterase